MLKSELGRYSTFIITNRTLLSLGKGTSDVLSSLITSTIYDLSSWTNFGSFRAPREIWALSMQSQTRVLPLSSLVCICMYKLIITSVMAPLSILMILTDYFILMIFTYSKSSLMCITLENKIEYNIDLRFHRVQLLVMCTYNFWLIFSS